MQGDSCDRSDQDEAAATHKTSAAAAEANVDAAAAAVSSELAGGFVFLTSLTAGSCKANAARGGEPATRKIRAYVRLFVPMCFLRAGLYCANNSDWSASK